MTDPKMVHTPIDAIERAKEHARAAEKALDLTLAEATTSYAEDVALHAQVGQLWATIAIAQRSGR